MRTSVIIVTINRPQCIRTCLTHLVEHDPAPDQIIVVDASADSATRDVVNGFPGVDYLRNSAGDGHTTESRNIGVMQSTGDIIAFLDDDAYVRSGWLNAIVSSYSEESVGAVGGRALRNQAGEESEGVDQIGLFTKNGIITGNFAADPGQPREVDHLIGCNMSFRREVIAQCGGFRPGFPGYCLREESDIFLVMHKLGYRIIFNPLAVVDHVAGPKPKGRRFDLRYEYYAERNHYVLLIRNFGLFHPIVWRYLAVKAAQSATEFVRRVVGAAARVVAGFAGTLVGLCVGTGWRLRQGSNPTRRDAVGVAVTSALQRPGAANETEKDGFVNAASAAINANDSPDKDSPTPIRSSSPIGFEVSTTAGSEKGIT